MTEKPLLIGIYLATGQHAQWGAFFSGLIDDVAIFNTVLADDEIESIMKFGLEKAASIEASNKLTLTWATIKTD